jgi:LAO/AO transport system kinase
MIEVKALVEEARAGSKRAVAKLVSAVERGGSEAGEVLRELWPHTGGARVIGITGPPGAGKSTLTDQMSKEWLKAGHRIGVIAVDPSSPFSGGAILGDRVRMADLTLDPNVFIRSMSTRGQLGGLSAACGSGASVLDACGYDMILLETVGVGQSEIEVIHHADLVIVVSIPGAGDDVQAIKAGILEIGDVFVVNKADRPGSDRTAAELRTALSMDETGKSKVPVMLASATENRGISELCAEADKVYGAYEASGLLKKRRAARLRETLMTLVREGFYERILSPVLASAEYQAAFESFLKRHENPYVWANHMIDQWSGGKEV